jgi:hypothetical protein
MYKLREQFATVAFYTFVAGAGTIAAACLALPVLVATLGPESVRNPPAPQVTTATDSVLAPSPLVLPMMAPPPPVSFGR